MHNIAAAMQPSTVLPTDLLNATHVLVCQDGHVPLLELLYDGPFQVLRPSSHYFTIQMGSKADDVSTLQLKLCLMPAVFPQLL